MFNPTNTKRFALLLATFLSWCSLPASGWADTHGRNVTEVVHNYGKFTQVAPRQWKETLGGNIGYFTEVMRDEWSVYLEKSNGVRLMLDLYQKKVRIAEANGYRDLYAITSASARPAPQPNPGPNPQPNPQPNPGPNPGPQPGPAQNELFYRGLTSLGKGYNLFAASEDQIVTTDVVLFDPAARTAHIFGHAVPMPGNLDFNTIPGAQFKSDFESYESAYKIQQGMQASLGVSGSYMGVTASIESEYGRSSSQSSGRSFIEYRAELAPLVVKFNPAAPKRVHSQLTSQFRTMETTTWHHNANFYRNFFRQYGTHYVREITMGAVCSMRARVSHSANMSASELRQAASVSFESKKLGIGVQQAYQSKVSRFESSSEGTIMFRAQGGNPEIVVSGQRIIPRAWQAWAASTQQPYKLSDIRRKLGEITELVSNPTARYNLQTALQQYARENHRPLDNSKPVRRPVEYQVTVTAHTMKVANDGDSGADGGDLYWNFAAQTVNPRDNSRGTAQTIDSRTNENYKVLYSGSTYFFSDIRGSHGQAILTVKPGHRVELTGRISDDDDFLNGGDDHFGSMRMNIDIANGGVFERSHRFNGGGGDVTVTFKVSVTPRY